MKPSALRCFAACLFLSAATAAELGTLSPEQVLKQSRDTYVALTSYADTGSVTTRYHSGRAPESVETYTFRTAYQTPRQFLFDFKKGMDAGAERFVIWSEGQDFNSWWSATQVHEDYPQGQGANAFALSAYPTQESSVMIPALLFSKAGLQGPLSSFTLLKGAGTEKLGEHLCYRLIGQEAMAYKTGTVAGGRAVTLWIDAETLLMRKIFEDTPDGDGGDILNTVTTSFEPVANPAIDPTRFHFEVPKRR